MLFSICHKKSGFGIRGMIQKRWIGIEDRKSSKLSALLVKDRCVLYPKIRSDRDQMREIPALCQLKNLDEPHVPMVPSIKIASMIAPLPCPLVKHTQSSKSGCRNTRTISTIDSIEQRSYLKKIRAKKSTIEKNYSALKRPTAKQGGQGLQGRPSQ